MLNYLSRKNLWLDLAPCKAGCRSFTGPIPSARSR